ncbi:MAG: adenosine kinase [Bdellovibrionales bacterium]
MSSPAVYDVCALGNAIVDIVAEVPEDFVVSHAIPKSGMMLVDHATITMLRRSVKTARAVRAGGGSGNMVAGIASFGGKAAYIGKIAHDEIGNLFSADLKKLGVDFPIPPLMRGGAASGLCMAFVTPGGDRSMCTFLGASVELDAADIDGGAIRAAQVTYLEGYMLDRIGTKLALMAAADAARGSDRRVALALCDPGCVERNRADFLELVRGKTDILFANERELLTLFPSATLDQAIAELKRHVQIGVVTRSDKGSIVVDRSRHFTVPAEPIAQVVDKTGAGDAYAAGFLFGLARSFDLTLCARLGAIAAAEAISHYGPRPEQSLAALARQKGALL